MGLEATCTLRIGDAERRGKAHLEADRLTVGGPARWEARFCDIRRVEVDSGGRLLVESGGRVALLTLGDRKTAEAWVNKIRNPRSLMDKLGVKPGSVIALVGVEDSSFEAQAAAVLGAPPPRAPTRGLDLLFYAADSLDALGRLGELKACLKPAGAIWVVSLKGKAARIKDTDVMRAAKAAGLVDTKVCAFSATHTALKLMIPKAARA